MSANILGNSVPPVPENVQLPAGPPWLPILQSWITQIARALNLARQGHINAVTTITLTAGATTTTITDDRIGPKSTLIFTPTSASAIVNNPWVSAKGSGTATLTHGNSAAADQTFDVAILG